MNGYLVVATDAARARFLHLQAADVPEVESGPDLVEADSLLNPEHPMTDREIFADSKAGRNRTFGGPTHGYDDHRRQHMDELSRRFARQIAKETVRHAKAQSAHTLVVVADKRMLGFLRTELNHTKKPDWTIRECAVDISKLSARELHRHLAEKKMVPSRKGPGSA